MTRYESKSETVPFSVLLEKQCIFYGFIVLQVFRVLHCKPRRTLNYLYNFASFKLTKLWTVLLIEEN